MFESLNPLYFYPYIDEERKQENEKSELFPVKESTMYGNLFRNEYIPYKNYVPRMPSPRTPQEKLLMDIAFYSNASHDLELYLDVYPSHTEYIKLFEMYSKKAKELEEEYNEKYGTLYAADGKNKEGYFSYVTEPSVWLKGE